MKIFQRYRILFVIYGLALLAGSREYFLGKWEGRIDLLSDRWADMTEVVTEVNPDDPDTDFLLGLEALKAGDEADFVREFEKAIASGVKHNNMLLHDYAQYLLNRGADWQAVNDAVNRWRQNFPFSAETLFIPLGTGPRNQADVAVLHRSLSMVPWVAGSQLEPYTEGGVQRWRVLLTFKPAVEVDIRQAIAAMTILSVPPEERSRVDITCRTLVDCTVSRRPSS